MKIIKTNKAPAAIGPYSQGIILNGLLFVSGQIPFHPDTMEAPDSIEEQTKQSLENVKAILKAGNSSLNNVIKVNISIINMNDFDKINKVYAQYFGTHKPARACVQVAALPKGVQIEIEVIAKVD